VDINCASYNGTTNSPKHGIKTNVLFAIWTSKYYHVTPTAIPANPLSSFPFETVKTFILKFENIGLLK